jgi:P-type Cu+ transporter
MPGSIFLSGTSYNCEVLFDLPYDADYFLTLSNCFVVTDTSVFFIRMVCPSIPLINTLLNMHCGPFLMGDLLKWVLVSIVQFVIGKRFYVAAYRAV